jgi:hypothetical protein
MRAGDSLYGDVAIPQEVRSTGIAHAWLLRRRHNTALALRSRLLCIELVLADEHDKHQADDAQTRLQPQGRDGQPHLRKAP